MQKNNQNKQPQPQKPTSKDYKIIKNSSDQTECGQYEILSTLQNSDTQTKGTYLINHQLNVAIKYLANQPKAQQGYKKDIEVSKILVKEPSANIIQVYKVQEVKSKEEDKIEKGFIIMQKGKQTLTSCVNESIDKKLKYIGDIAKGLDHLHKCGIVHRDMKAENVLITFSGVAKIFDFGASKYYGNTKEGDNFIYKLTEEQKKRNPRMVNTQNAIGTTIFNPPEILLDSMEIKVLGSCDMWQFGLLIAILVWGIEKFAHSSNYLDDCEKTQDQWKDNPNSNLRIKFPPLDKIKIGFNNQRQLYYLVQQCLYYHPDRRITSSDFVKEYFNRVMNQNKIDKKVNEVQSQTDIKRQYIQPKQLTNSEIKGQILRGFIEKCTKDFTNCDEKNVNSTIDDLVQFAKSTLSFDAKKSRRLVQATLRLMRN